MGVSFKIWDISIPSFPVYVGGGDSDGGTNDGNAGSSRIGIEVSW